MQLTFDPVLLVGFCLGLVRATAWALVCPPFNAPAIPVRVRAGFAVALAFVVAPRFGEVAASLGTGGFVATLLLQAFAGLALGLIVLVLFSAVQAAGELIDLQVGTSLGGVIDPMSGNMAAPIGRFHQLLGLAILFAVDGHVLVVRGFLRSVSTSPSGAVDTGALSHELTSLLGTMFAGAIEIALPVLAALFCTEVALGLLGKAAPQLNILVIGFAVKTIVAGVLLAATLVLLPGATSSLLVRAVRAGARVFGG